MLSMDQIQKLAKALDTPEMRDLYRRQKRINPNLDHDLQEVAKKVEDVFQHRTNSNGNCSSGNS